MKKIIISFLFLATSIGITQQSFAQNILTEMQNRKEALYKQLDNENDKVKRYEILTKISQINNMYYEQDIRDEMIYQSNPAYFKNVKRKSFAELNTIKEPVKVKPTEPQIYTAPQPSNADDIWNSYENDKKITICKQTKNSCDAENNFENCRFVFRRCKPFLPKPEFDRFMERFSKRVR
jgi:type II secretory pathway pseudopilin PulG